jgi:hypothetical protein
MSLILLIHLKEEEKPMNKRILFKGIVSDLKKIRQNNWDFNVK